MFYQKKLFLNEITYQYEETLVVDYKVMSFLHAIVDPAMTFPNATEAKSFSLNDDRFSVHESVLIEKLVMNDILFYYDKTKRISLPARSKFLSLLYHYNQFLQDRPLPVHQTQVFHLSKEAMDAFLSGLYTEAPYQKINLYVANLHQCMNYDFHRDFRLEHINQQTVSLFLPPYTVGKDTYASLQSFSRSIEVGVTRFEVEPYITQGQRSLVFYGKSLNGKQLCTIMFNEDVHGILS